MTGIGSRGAWTAVEHVAVGGVPAATLSRPELTEVMVADCLAARAGGNSGRGRIVFDSNGHAVSMRRTSSTFRAALDGADVIHADGAIIVFASRLFAARPISQRSATTDMIHDFAEAAVRHGLSFYLLGGTEEVNRICAERLVGLYPGLMIAGRRNGYFTAAEEADVVADINAAKPDIVWVGLGKPKEQEFCLRHKNTLKTGWVITCGGCFNFVSGHYRRAPQWMQDCGLEWLHRLYTNPRQLFWRYMATNPHALYLILRYALDARFGRNV